MREVNAWPHEGWKQKPTQELDQILQAELEKQHPNEEVVLPILQILEEREADNPIEKTPENLALLEKLKEHNTPPKQTKHKRGWVAGVAAVAAMACIIVMALPRTVGAESIFDVLFRWTSSIFEFVDPDRNESYPNEDSDFTTEHPGLQQLYDKVTELGVTESVVPSWLPVGFKMSELKVSPATDGSKVHGKFENGSQLITISYRFPTNIATYFEKEDSAVEVFEVEEVSHFILDNDENLSATWTVNDVECSIVTVIQKEDLYEIIKSIYKRGLQ